MRWAQGSNKVRWRVVMQKMRLECHDEHNWLSGSPLSRVAYMDHIVGWSNDIRKMQNQLSFLQQELLQLQG